MLLPYYQKKLIEAGCDEAGRGCLAGPVFAAAVILPQNFSNSLLNDSKKLTVKQRNEMRALIEYEAIDYSVALVDNRKIDRINILNASILAMHMALDGLRYSFQFIIVDGNRFKPYKKISHKTIIKGDGKYMSIAAASVLAKTYRDAYMEGEHENYPEYDWVHNKGYGTEKHRQAIMAFGNTPIHRKSFRLKQSQMALFGR